MVNQLLLHLRTLVLGNYYLTMEEAGREGEGMVFKDRDEAVMAYRNGYVTSTHVLVLQQTAQQTMDRRAKT